MFSDDLADTFASAIIFCLIIAPIAILAGIFWLGKKLIKLVEDGIAK